MECEENIPPLKSSLRLDLDLATMAGAESMEDRYIRVAKEMAAYYGVTLCDEPEAQLIGAHAWQNIFFHGRSLSELPLVAEIGDVLGVKQYGVADFSRKDHLNFLRDYLQLHGLTYRDVDKRLHVLLTDTGQGLAAALWEDFKLSSHDVVASIRQLTSEYSSPTPQSAPTVQAEEGGIVIVGGKFDCPGCIPAKAASFRNLAKQKTGGHWSKAANGTASGGTPSKRSDRYQVNKCGRTEYSLRTDASYKSHKPLADGLTPTAPRHAIRKYASECCILEAKYVGSPKMTPYQKRRDYLRNMRKSSWLPRRLQGLKRAGLIAVWEGVRTTQAAQFGLYIGSIADPEIPYWHIVYICSRNSCRNYFRDIIKLAHVPHTIAKACTSDARSKTENWIV